MNPSFEACMTPKERKLAGRIESFGDIVFGFSMSQCALQLPTIHGHVNLMYPVNILLYFATFALLAMLWLTYHRLMSDPYRPTTVDLWIAFGYLALVSLMPYAMYSLSHMTETLITARLAIAEYAVLFGCTMALAAILSWRNLRRGWPSSADGERTDMWLRFVRRAMVCIVMGVATIVDLFADPETGSLVFLATIPLGLVIRKGFRSPPAALARVLERSHEALSPAPE